MDSLLLILLLLPLVVLVISLLFTKDMMSVVFITSVISVLLSLIYILLDAVDVAFTEIAVGAGVSTILFLAMVKITKSYSIDNPNFNITYSKRSFGGVIFLLLVVVVGVLLFDGLGFAPIFGDAYSPANSHNIYTVYTHDSYNTFQVLNAVTMVLGSFRGYDTLGETVVILIAALGVYTVLGDSNNVRVVNAEVKAIDPVISSGLFALMPILFLYGFYVQFHGDYGPGGGFQAGIILAGVYFLVILYFGYNVANKFINIKYLLYMLALGVAIYGFTGVVSMILGGKYLDYYVFGGNEAHSYHYGLFTIELGVGMTVFAAFIIIINKFYEKLLK